jgi:hypothetical protein
LDNKTQPLFPKSSIEFSKSDDFANGYANNVALESSLWDLRMIFGQNDQQLGMNAVVQHTSVTLPWPQVKVLKYFLDSNLLTYEVQHGRIHIPPNIVPALPHELPKELVEADPKAREVWAAIRANYDAFIKANPEAVSDGANKSKTS